MSGIIPPNSIYIGTHPPDDVRFWFDEPNNKFYIRTNTGWLQLNQTGTGSGDMLAATYDPTNVVGDAFDLDLHSGVAPDVNPAGTSIASALSGKLGTSAQAADVNPAGTAIAAALAGKLGTSAQAADVNPAGTSIAAALAGKAATNQKLDDFGSPDDNTDLNASTTAHGLVVKATAPAANVLNVVGIANGETAYTNKTLFDGTNPADLSTAAPGTSLVAAHRDHVHNAQTTVSGNAGTATTLQTARLINGASFNGSTDINADIVLQAYAAGGSPILAETMNFPLFICNTSTALVDNTMRLVAVWLPKAATLTGIRVYVRTQGSFTGDQNNKVGLYTYSGGTITLVASCANDQNIWKNAANAFATIAFSSTYAAAAGLHFVGLLYNQSAQTTAPTLAGGTALNNVAMATMLGTNSIKFLGTIGSMNDLPASQAMSGVTGVTASYWVGLY